MMKTYSRIPIPEPPRPPQPNRTQYHRRDTEAKHRRHPRVDVFLHLGLAVFDVPIRLLDTLVEGQVARHYRTTVFVDECGGEEDEELQCDVVPVSF